MSVDAALVRTWDVAAGERQARRLFTLADDLDRTYERLRRADGGLAGWTGPAADRARPRLRLAARTAGRLSARVRQAAEAVRRGLAGLSEAVRAVRVPAQARRDVEEAVVLAATVDGRIAAELGAAAADLARLSARPASAPSLPWAGSTPAEVARWWTALPPDLRRLVIEEHAGAAGRLAGLPAAVRDVANRLHLTRQLRVLRAEHDHLVGRLSTDPAQVRHRAAVAAKLRLAAGVDRQLVSLDRPGPPVHLLTLDLDGVGRVAIGVGDVDRARHVAVLVPGMRRDAGSGLARTVDEAVCLQADAARASPEPTAVVAWVGYAAPGVIQVPFSRRARAGGRLLAADLRALAASRAVDGGDPAHLTVVGHSYGSTVVGAAATTQRIPADDLVMLGSPGVLATRAVDLGVGGGHVFVGEAPLDPVADLGVFGTDPGDPEFGAVRIAADPPRGLPWSERLSGGDHSHYLDPGSESLRAVVEVVVGRRASVTGAG